MIYLILGTQAELIKLAPVALELMKRKIAFVPIYTGQHGQMTVALSYAFGLPEPDRFLQFDEISTTVGGLVWFARAATSRAGLGRDSSSLTRDVVVVQGDALSTMVGLVLAKRSHLCLAHVEAGLRSHSILDPFPEEIIREIVDACSDLLFAPSSLAYENLKKMKVRGKIYNTMGNTVLDAIRVSLRLDCSAVPLLPKPYAVATIHRYETIASRRRLARVLRLLGVVAQHHRIVLVIPRSTRERIVRLSPHEDVSNHSKIMTLDPLIYPTFIKIMNDAEFVVTDSGGIQEESFYLGKPCLLLRNSTERREGLGINVYISGFDEKLVKQFVRRYRDFAQKSMIDQPAQPSRCVVEALLEEGFG